VGRPGSRFIRPPGRRADSLQADTRSTLCRTSRPSRPWCNRSPARSSSARQLSVGCSALAAQRRLQVRQTRQAAGSAGRACRAGCTSVSVLAKVSNVRTFSSYTLRATHPSPTYSQSKPHVSCVVVRLSRVRACRHGEGGAKSIRCLQRTLGPVRSVDPSQASARPHALVHARRGAHRPRPAASCCYASTHVLYASTCLEEALHQQEARLRPEGAVVPADEVPLEHGHEGKPVEQWAHPAPGVPRQSTHA
jgi:hypothetical protein